MQITTGSFDLPVKADATTAGAGVDGCSNVMCLSCHRAHASAFPNGLRWDMTEAFIADTWTTMVGDGTVLATAAAAEYYKHGVEADVAVFDPASTPFTNGYGHYQCSLRGGPGCLNRSDRFSKWISPSLVMLPLFVAAR